MSAVANRDRNRNTNTSIHKHLLLKQLRCRNVITGTLWDYRAVQLTVANNTLCSQTLREFLSPPVLILFHVFISDSRSILHVLYLAFFFDQFSKLFKLHFAKRKVQVFSQALKHLAINFFYFLLNFFLFFFTSFQTFS